MERFETDFQVQLDAYKMLSNQATGDPWAKRSEVFQRYVGEWLGRLNHLDICHTDIYQKFLFIREYNQILKLTYKSDYLPNLRASLKKQRLDLEQHPVEIREKIDVSGVLGKIAARISDAENLWGNMKRVKSMNQLEFESYITYLEKNQVLLVDSDIEKSEYCKRIEAYCKLVQKFFKQLSEKRAVTSAVFKNDWNELNNNVNRNYSLTLPAYLVNRVQDEIRMGEKLNHTLREMIAWTRDGRPTHKKCYEFLKGNYEKHSSFDLTIEDEITKLDVDQEVMSKFGES